MHEGVGRLSGRVVDLDQDLAREFDALLAESGVLAFRVAYSVLRQREDAEDVAQEALAKAYRNFRQIRDRSRFRGWLVRTAWRLALDRRRGDRRRGERELVVADAEPAAPGVSPGTHLRQVELWRAIDELPDTLRVTLVLASIEGHEVREVAELLGVPEGTVKSRLFLARRRLRERLG